MFDAMTLDVHYPYRRNPHRATAEAHHRRWMEEFRMLGSRMTPDSYARWEIPDLAALTYPDGDAEDLALATDLMGFYFVFDDEFDGVRGRRPAGSTELCDQLIGVLHGSAAPADSPCVQGFESIWWRIRQVMSPRWVARAAYNWEAYFASHPAEAASRLTAEAPGRTTFLFLRRGTSAMETVLDMVERVGRFEVCPTAFHSPALREVRQLAADIAPLSNDVHSYPQEVRRGDVANLVLVVQRERGCTLSEASAVAIAEVQEQADRLAELREELPRTYRALQLTADQVRDAQRYVEGLMAVVAGYIDWEGRTVRYRSQAVARSG
ncbi:hypothetical protein C7C46_30220 [Streptomyces tateyamensis]|uniref:Terpene synthase n=1 Tax=Streptomyces tateyamensis TaxID=565073 RepID=A0A2V4NHS9_9ACTN|nr:hypothetical protein [Streptomyces tateyamensis]PYC67418.1 hypothetical protein C7C46_30220 [Streptomyces tateyamensis]